MTGIKNKTERYVIDSMFAYGECEWALDECKIIFTSTACFGDGKDYKSVVMNKPKKEEILNIANESIIKTGDFHHVFLENLSKQETLEDGTVVVEMEFGS